MRPIARTAAGALLLAVTAGPFLVSAAPSDKDTAPLPALPSLPSLPDAGRGAAPKPALPAAPAASSRSARADPATVTKAGPLRQGPSRASRELLHVPEGSRVDVTGMAGAWSRVRVAGGQSGWMPVDALRIGGETRAESGSWLRKLTGALRRGGGSRQPSGSGDAVSVGVRGLTAEQVRAARPDIRAVDGLERLAVSGPEARARASEVGLGSRAVPFEGLAAVEPGVRLAADGSAEAAR